MYRWSVEVGGLLKKVSSEELISVRSAATCPKALTKTCHSVVDGDSQHLPSLASKRFRISSEARKMCIKHEQEGLGI